MKKKLIVYRAIIFIIILIIDFNKIYAQSNAKSKDIFVSFSKMANVSEKKNIQFNDEGIKLSNPGFSGVLISHKILIPIKYTPFLHLAVSCNTKNFNKEIFKIFVRTSINGTNWNDWLQFEGDEHLMADEDEDTEIFFYSHLQFYEKGLKYIQYKIEISNSLISIKNLNLRFFSPGDFSRDENFKKNDLLLQSVGCPCPSVAYITRAGWGCQQQENCPVWDPITSSWITHPVTTPVTHIIVHHADGYATPPYDAQVRAIWDDHVVTASNKHWKDIAYNWIIDPDGNLYKGRAWNGNNDNVIGTHMCGCNSKKIGICLLGNFNNNQPTTAAYNTLIQLLAWKGCAFNIDLLDSAITKSKTFSSSCTNNSMFNISGHKDGCQGYTCPGNLFYPQMQTLRNDVYMYSNNCVNSPPTPTISSSNGTNICDGESTTLTASSAGATNYLWSTGSTASSINITTAGTYLVTSSNINGNSSPGQIAISVYSDHGIQWQNTIGGNHISHPDDLICIKQTSDAGYILGGYSPSNISSDKTENSMGSFDYWVVKLDSIGSIQWDNTIGGSNTDNLTSLEKTSDGGYILGGSSFSNISGDKSENCSLPYCDYWVVRLDAMGNILWDNTIGGSNSDNLSSLQQTVDGGYIIGGTSYSNISIDKTENCLGSSDFWVLKLDSIGNIQWDNTIGGSGVDKLVSLHQTTDGGYILGGYSNSNISIDKNENSLGQSDYWVVKLDAFGNIQWQNTIGGSLSEELKSIKQTTDGGYILGGYSYSNISGDKTENSLGGPDYWVVKLDSFGNIQWNNTIGGSNSDVMLTLQQTIDGGFILGGYSISNISIDKTEDHFGVGTNYWIVKLDAIGNIQWDNTIGGNLSDIINDLSQTFDNGYILGGTSNSNISFDKTENCLGGSDYWVVKLGPTGLCPAPYSGLLPTNISSTSVKVNWNTRSCAQTYNVQYRVNGTTTWITKTKNSNTGYLTLTGLSPATTYQWKVRTKCNTYNNINSAYSQIQTFTTSAPRFGEQIMANIRELSVYPNPNTGQFLLEFNADNNYSAALIEIFNSFGQSIYRKTIEINEGENSKEIDLSNLPSGIYFISLRTESEVFRQKIVKE